MAQVNREQKEKLEEAARERAARDRKNQTRLGVIVVIVLVVVLCLGGFFIWKANRPQSTSGSSSAATSSASALAAVEAVKVKPSYATKTGGFVMSKNGIDKPVKGVPTIQLYTDFICPACGDVDRQIDSTLIAMVKAGQINLEMHPDAFLDRSSTDQYSTRSAAAAVYIAQNDPSQFLAVVKAFFEKPYQPEEAENYKPVSDAMIAQQEETAAGVPASMAEASVKGTYTAWVNAESAYTVTRTDLQHPSGEYKGEMTTPTFQINGHYWLFDDAWSQTGSPETALLKAIGLSKQNVGNASVKPELNGTDAPLFPTSASATGSAANE